MQSLLYDKQRCVDWSGLENRLCLTQADITCPNEADKACSQVRYTPYERLSYSRDWVSRHPLLFLKIWL